MSPALIKVILGVQCALLVLAAVTAAAGRTSATARALAWLSTGLASVGVLLAATMMAGNPLALVGSTGTWITYGVMVIVATGLTWAVARVIGDFRRNRVEARLETPERRSMLAEELREVLRREGIALDERLRQAEHDREQFLYALEDRHARQIAGLAQEYQHEAQGILRQLLDQLAADQLQPMVEQQIAEHRQEIDRELGAIDAAGAGETLNEVRAELKTLLADVEAAEGRIAKAISDNPDQAMEEKVEARLAAIEGQIDGRVAGVTASFDDALEEMLEKVDARIADVGRQVDEHIDAASNPLAMRMIELQGEVEKQLASYLATLDQRFAETEALLNDRVQQQEMVLDARVVEIEKGVDERLAIHDDKLAASLIERTNQFEAHFGAERDRLVTELTGHVVDLQERIASDLASIEAQAQETVGAAQQGWNTFTEELEERFAVTREEALRAAHEIAQAERAALEEQLTAIASEASQDIASKVEEAGREAAWQRSQVERSVMESTEMLQRHARAALADADKIFADLDRVGGERVEAIRRQAEDALVQSRDYVGQLQDSLGAHLETLRVHATGLADEMNERVSSVTAMAHETAARIEQHAREVVESANGQLTNTAQAQVAALEQRFAVDFATSIQRGLEEQQVAYERHLNDVAQRIVQQVQGDLAGISEHARSAVTSELDMVIAQARDHARRSQEEAFRTVMTELARQQSEMSDQARSAAEGARSIIERGLQDSRRQLEEAMATMGAHMREELVRFQDEGQRRVGQAIEQLRNREHESLREEDRRLQNARGELLRQHQGALEEQVRNLVGGLGGSGSSFSDGIDRPSTPLSSQQISGSFGSQPIQQ